MARSFIFSFILLIAIARAGEADFKVTELLPPDSLAVVVVPDLSETRAAAAKTRLAEMYSAPEMQEFLKPILAQLSKTYEDLHRGNALVPAFADLDAALLSGELALSVYPRGDNEGIPVGVLLAIQPKSLDALKKVLPEHIRNGLDKELVALTPDPNGPALSLAGNKLLLGFPQGDLPRFVLLAKNQAAREKFVQKGTAFSKFAASVPNSRAFVYANVERILELVKPMMAAPDEKMTLEVINKLGLANVATAGFGLSFNNENAVFQAAANFSSEPKDNLLSLFLEEAPVSAAGMKVAAPDSPFTQAIHVRFEQIMPMLKQLASMADPNAPQYIDQGLAGAQLFLGFNIGTELLPNLGPEIVITQTAVDTSGPFSLIPGLVFSVGLKDPVKVQRCVEKAFAMLEKPGLAAMTGGEMPLKVKRVDYKNRKIIYFTATVLPGPGVFCVDNGRLLYGTTLNALKRGIDQLDAAEDLSKTPAFQLAIMRMTGGQFDPLKIPPFSYSLDRGTGSGTLALTAVGVASATGALAGLASIPNFEPRPAGVGTIEMNENAAAAACKAYSEAQDIYRRTDWNKNGVLEYAQSLSGDLSLFESKAGEADVQLIEKDFAAAEGEPGAPAHYRGYRFKVLKAQGDKAPDGKRTYMNKNGQMTLGYALVAYPQTYGTTGKRSFLIDNRGTVVGKDLGATTADLVKAMTEYNPDPAWLPVKVEIAQAEDFDADNPFGMLNEFFVTPQGKVVLEMGNAVDLGFWPDGEFFTKRQKPTAAAFAMTPRGITFQTELPPPMPAFSGIGGGGMMTSVAVVSIIAAIAIPNLLRSRTAANEAAAAASCRAYAEAQDIYRRTDYNKDGVLEYAQALGGPNSLYETVEGQADVGMIDRTFALAEDAPGKVPSPKAGYFFKILKAQGQHAPGGKRSYIGPDGKHMTLGYALVAYPAQYDATGRNTFIISNAGTIYQQDMGPQTEEIVKKMEEFDPDPQAWVVAE